jgi:hypothetical protein
MRRSAGEDFDEKVRNGTLTVAEAGHGGDVCFPGGHCVGASGQISTINLATGTHTPLVSGLFSALDPEGGAIGVDGLSAQGGRLLAIMGIFPQALDGATCTGQRAGRIGAETDPAEPSRVAEPDHRLSSQRGWRCRTGSYAREAEPPSTARRARETGPK